MKSVLASGLIVMIALFLAASCAPTYKLTNGTYHMSLKTGKETEKMQVKTVMVIVDKGQVTIRNPESDHVLSGQLEGGRFTVSSRDGDQMIEFSGVLAADNQVKGKAIQKKGNDVMFDAVFEMAPVN